MSFLFCLGKAELNQERLETLLCPYEGGLHLRSISGGGKVYWTRLGEEQNESIRFPAGHKNEANSAWCEFSIQGQSLSITTDPLGQFPVWIARTENGFFISGELKSFSAIRDFSLQWKDPEEIFAVRERMPDESPCHGIQRLYPGKKLRINLISGELEVEGESLPWHLWREDPSLTMAEAQASLKAALALSVSEIPLDNTGCFLSGGIDSSVISALLAKRKQGFPSFNLSTPLGNESGESWETAGFLGLESHAISITAEEILPAFEQVSFTNELTDGLTAEILLQLELLIGKISGPSQFATGYGADLLFGGMLRHQAYMQATGVSSAVSLLDRTAWSREFSPFFAWAKGARLFHGYWHPEVIKAALKIPLSLQFRESVEKDVLRSLAVKEGWLTEPLAYRPKLGMTNGTQVNRLLSEALGLASEHEYSRKSQIAFARLAGRLR